MARVRILARYSPSVGRAEQASTLFNTLDLALVSCQNMLYTARE